MSFLVCVSDSSRGLSIREQGRKLSCKVGTSKDTSGPASLAARQGPSDSSQVTVLTSICVAAGTAIGTQTRRGVLCGSEILKAFAAPIGLKGRT